MGSDPKQHHTVTDNGLEFYGNRHLDHPVALAPLGNYKTNILTHSEI